MSINKFYWNTAVFIHFRLVCGCFHTTEQGIWDRNGMAYKPKIYSVLYREILQTPMTYETVFNLVKNHLGCEMFKKLLDY